MLSVAADPDGAGREVQRRLHLSSLKIIGRRVAGDAARDGGDRSHRDERIVARDYWRLNSRSSRWNR
jgi:hypothetical protein